MGGIFPELVEGSEFDHSSRSVHPMSIILRKEAWKIIGKYVRGNQLEDPACLVLRADDKTFDITFLKREEDLSFERLERRYEEIFEIVPESRG